MAKRNDENRGSRPRRPKRIISGITEFIDDNWWEDSRRPGRDTKRHESEESGESDKSGERKTSSASRTRKKTASKDNVAPTKEKGAPARAKTSAKTAAKDAARTSEKAPAKASTESSASDSTDDAEHRAKVKRKRSRRRGKKTGEATTSEVMSEPSVQKPTGEKRTGEKIPAERSSTEGPDDDGEVPVKRKRRRRSKKSQSSRQEPGESAATPELKSEPKPERKSESKPEPKPRRAEEVAAVEKPRQKQARPTEKQPEKPRRERPAGEKSERAERPRRERPAREPVDESTSERLPREKEAVAKKPAAPVKKTPTKGPAQPRSKTGFGAMNLSDEMFEALELAGYSEPTPIQEGLIPEALKGIDLMGQAQTGTGKTAAFAIPLLEAVDDVKHRGPQALVLVPTRELAVQVRDEVAKLAVTGEIQVVAVYGGKPIRRQIEKLQRAPEIVVGTPGRVIDLHARGALFFGDLRQIVLDEADRMLDIGFRPDIEKILRNCPESRQTLLLSATLPAPVLRLAQRYMRDPKSLDFSPANIAVETIEQFYFTVDPERKFDLLVALLERENPKQAIVFCRTRRGTEKIYRRLSKQNVESVACIHGDLTQSARDSAMRAFRAGKLQILVATDVVGRGIDVSGVSHIINYDIPEFCDDYVHRVGRTGRMGREGVAYTFVSPEEGPQLTRIEIRINMLLTRAEMPGFDVGSQDVQRGEGEGNTEPSPPPESKPVFGRSPRRFRRAL